MVQSVDVTGTSTTISGLNQNTLYYYTITAYNHTTPSQVSTPQSNRTAVQGLPQIIEVGGKIFDINSVIAEIAGMSVAGNSIIARDTNQIVMRDGNPLVDRFMN